MFAFDNWKRNINEYCTNYSRVVISVYSESFSLAHKADCVFVFGGLGMFQSFCLTKSCHLTLLLTSSLPPLLQDVWIVYLSVRPGLGKATARASADWCRSTAPPAVISVTVRSSSGNGSSSPGGRKKKKKKKTEKVFSQLSSTRSCCEPFANGATGANRSSHAELRWRFSRVWFVGRLHLALGESVFYFWRVAAFQNAHTAGPLPADCSLTEGCFTQVLLIRQLPL